jgi:alkylation response protein AidB-like acyl-CoA dehydrogenase
LPSTRLMYLELTDEQEFLVEAATGALSRRDTLTSARAALDGAALLDLWELAREAGWPGLLSSETVDGAGLGAYEAMLVLEACGERLANTQLLGHLSATALIELGDFADPELRRGLAAGDLRAALIDTNLTSGGLLVSSSDEDTISFDGSVAHVIDAPGADILVVVDGDQAGVLDASASGVTVEAQTTYDATRVLAKVQLRAVAARRLTLRDEQAAIAYTLQRALLAAEAVGAASACLRMSRDYAIDRYAFGRAIGSYQAIKHKLVEMMRRIENARSLVVQAGRSWDDEPSRFALAANAARVIATDALDFASVENIFIHGGIGATWEHDAQLYYRRAELSRRLAGGCDAAAEAVADELLAGVQVVAPEIGVETESTDERSAKE